MADLLDGDTIHHALGISVFNRTGAFPWEDINKGQEIAKRMFGWRWLLIDEISMVSARLLAEINTKLRHVVRSQGAFKYNAHGDLRSFGGLNVLISGDFWQLPPPDGGSLGDIPYEYIAAAPKYVPAANIAHGQSLLLESAGDGNARRDRIGRMQAMRRRMAS